MLPIQPGEVHWWFTYTDSIHQKALITDYLTLLNTEEEQRRTKFKFEKHQHQHLVTRALIRTTLSRYAPIPPQEWQFSKNDYGRPSIIRPSSIPNFKFNISHTDGLVMCAITLDTEIGIDVENFKREGMTHDIARRFFSKRESADLISLENNEQQKKCFYHYWTLKEAYIKAKGMGISLPLDQFSYIFNADQLIKIEFDPRLNDHSKDWQFKLIQVAPHYCAAIALQRYDQPDYHLKLNQVIPLHSENPLTCEVIASS